MKRNEKEEKYKVLRRLAKRDREIGYWRGAILDWVPVEEPKFIGHEYQVVLTESGMRRRDASVLNELLSALGKPIFYHRDSFTRIVRLCGHRIDHVKQHFNRHENYNHFANQLFEASIREYAYERLSEDAQKWFNIENRVTMSGYAYKEYRLLPGFPYYETKIKVSKTYSTHRGIPRADEIREAKIIHDALMMNNYWCAKNGDQKANGRCTWFGQYMNKRVRSTWNHATRMISKNITDVDDIECAEKYEVKIHPKKVMPWS